MSETPSREALEAFGDRCYAFRQEGSIMERLTAELAADIDHNDQ